jgi:nicotinamidase-related amidase
MLLARDKSQLLIVDVQDKLIGAISGKKAVVEACVRLVRAARALEVPITLSEQYPQGLGPTRSNSPVSETRRCASGCTSFAVRAGRKSSLPGSRPMCA